MDDDCEEPSFTFQRRQLRVDWRSLASINIEQVSRNLDISSLQKNLTNIAFCDIEAEDLRDVDQHVVKLFKLAQLMLEYVLFSQGQLERAKVATDTSLVTTAKERDDLLSKYNTARLESKRRRNMIASYQRLIDSQNLGPNKCKFCSKSFVTPSYLMSHCERRHPERAPFDIDLSAGAGHASNAAVDKAASAVANADKLGTLPDLVRELQTEIKIVRSEIERPKMQAVQADTYEIQCLRADLAQRDAEIAQLKDTRRHGGSGSGATLRADLEQEHAREMAKQKHEFLLERERLEATLQAQHARELEMQIEQTVQAAQRSNLGAMQDDVEDMALQARAEKDKEQYLRNEAHYEKRIALMEQLIRQYQAGGQSDLVKAASTEAHPVSNPSGGSKKKRETKETPPPTSSSTSEGDSNDSEDDSAVSSKSSASSTSSPSPAPAPKMPKIMNKKATAGTRNSGGRKASRNPPGSVGSAGPEKVKKPNEKERKPTPKPKVKANAKKEAGFLPRKVNNPNKQGESAKMGTVTSEHTSRDGKVFAVNSLFKHSTKELAKVRDAVEETFEHYLVEAGVARGTTQITESHLEDALNELESVIGQRSYSRVWDSNSKGKKPGASIYADLERQTDKDIATAEKKFYHNPRDASTSSDDEDTQDEDDDGTAVPPTAVEAEVESEDGNVTQDSFMSSAISSDVSSNVSSALPDDDDDNDEVLLDASPVAAERPATKSPLTAPARDDGNAKSLSATLASEALVFRNRDSADEKPQQRSETDSAAIVKPEDVETRDAGAASPPVELQDSFESVSSNGSLLHSDSLGGLSSHHGGDQSNIDSLSGLLQERGHIGGSGPPQPPPRGSPPAPPPRPTTASPLTDNDGGPLTNDSPTNGGGAAAAADLVGEMSMLDGDSDWDDDLTEDTLSR